ncbi:MAG TPA: T9SS type A sorting domain-containing protein, partial [Ignavibacteriaceae bacterium]|nr:T9SS type A sorting domain-containing protein [Ignavibacteriaceae bacterium]
MKRTISNLSILFVLILALNVNVFSQQCKVITKNVKFESLNSLTFDVYVQNDGSTDCTYSNGSYVWNYDPAFLNGGTPTFSLVEGYSSFPTNAQPPSALITGPNILRTSSNMPGSNGVIPAGQSLRLYRFRLQTTASSFNGSYFNISWKTSGTPSTKIFGWDNGSGLPTEITSVNLSVQQLLFEENFDYGAVANPDITAITSNWTRHSGTAGPAYVTTSLSYPLYLSSGIGGAVQFTYGASGNNDGDVNRVFPNPVTTNNDVYTAFLLNLTAARTTADYFFHFGQSVIGTNFKARVFGRSNGDGWSFGLSKSTETRVDDNTVLNFNQTYLVVLKYTLSSAANNDDVVTLYVYDNGYPSTEPGSPLVTIGPVGAGVTGDLTEIGSIAIRQGTNTPTGTIDGIRVGTFWTDIFPGASGDPLITVSPQALSGFNYQVGGGPSASQSYNLSGSDLVPASGNIVVTGSTNYEVSLNNTTFSSSLNVPYSGGSLASTQVYVRLKAGLPGGVYNGEEITNAGGGAVTKSVICNGMVGKSEPTNHVTNFAGVLGNPSYYYINLNWNDATGAVTPDGYLIRGSQFSFDSIKVPVDGTPVANSLFDQNVAQGIQTKTFGLNSATTYYFKIFPYSNSGANINYKTDDNVPQFSIATDNAPSLPIIENFEYATGSNLTDNGWIAHSGAGNNPIKVNDTPLSYIGYINSGLGKSVSLTTSGEDVNRAFSSVTSGSVYASFMVNFSSAQTNGDYFFHVAPENNTSLFYAKVWVKKNAGDSLAFGLTKRMNTPVYTPFNYELNTTYLFVVKYTFVDGLQNDEVSLWINPVLDGTEPPANLTHTEVQDDALSLGLFALRQGSVSNAANLTLGGLRVATTWVPQSSGGTTFPLSVNITDGWNMVSVPGTNPDGMGVNTWWQYRDPLATVYKWANGANTPVTITAPTEGYWMFHSGTRTYNTGDEWPAGGIQIVTHSSIPVTTGWNMFGVYEQSVPAANLSTTPANLIVSGTLYSWTGSYSNPTNLDPGYGYWVYVSGSGVINPPSALKGGGGDAVLGKEISKDWGRIIISDSQGKSYTLYSVKGEVDLTHYLLPPLPPAGSFDIRYSSGHKAEDLSTDQTIDMQGLVYPITVKAEGQDIRVQDISGKLVNTGLKSGEELVIDNSSINKLMVSGTVIPDVYALEQNYPNPFNPSTVIEFSLPEDVNDVRLTIYDVIGQKVAELVNGKLDAGKYKYTWNAINAAAGIYIYELRAN